MAEKYIRRSRITKALTDAQLVDSFEDAETELDSIHPCVLLGTEQARTRAGQAATLTIAATALKCFGRCTVLVAVDTPLLAPLPIGSTLTEALRQIGADVSSAHPDGATHLIGIGAEGAAPNIFVACWWDRWLSGIRTEACKVGDSRLALSGIFAGALAVRQIFASLLARGRRRPVETTISLWEPWSSDCLELGPTSFIAPTFLWLIGLGHLGQAFVWNLVMLPYSSARRVILQDDDKINDENEPTSLLVTNDGYRNRKVRLASQWLENAGWETWLLERRFRGDLSPTLDDPPILLSGLDSLAPRKLLVEAGFEFMIDAGIGHGPHDFEGIQIRVTKKGANAELLWGHESHSADPVKDRLLSSAAYCALEKEVGECGKFTLANASVAVPFVGAAAGALAISQAIRLSSSLSGGALIQMELATPELMIDGGQSIPPESFLGGEQIDLAELA